MCILEVGLLRSSLFLDFIYFFVFLAVYMLFDGNVARHPGSIARIISPSFPPAQGERCVGFEYADYGKDASRLSVLTQTGQVLWSSQSHSDTTQFGDVSTECKQLFLRNFCV